MQYSCLLELLFSPHFLNTVVEEKASGQQLVLKLWLGVSKGMLSVEYFGSTEPLFVSVEFNGDHKTAHKDEVKSGHPQVRGFYRI